MLTNSQYISPRTYARYTKLYDVPVSGNQYVHDNAYLATAAYHSKDHYNSDVAYDPCTRKFIAVFYYDFNSDGSDYDVYAVAKVSTTAATGFTPFSVATSENSERDPAISFVKDNYLTAYCGSMDKLVVTYVRTDVGIKATDLRGNSDTTSPSYNVDLPSVHLAVRNHSDSFKHSHPVISSSSMWARMFIVYQATYQFPPNDGDIWGRLVHVREPGYREPFFLPLVVR
jgi:hypothetical protein